MKKAILVYGLIGGFIISIFLVLGTYLMKDNMAAANKYGQYYGYATMVIALSTIFFGIKQYRDKEAGGSISFGKGFLIGLGISALAGAMYTGTWMVYSSTFDVSFEQQYFEQVKARMKEEGKSEAEMKRAEAEGKQMVKLMKNPAIKAGVTFLEIFPVGLLVSLISAALLRRKHESIP